MSQKNTSAAKVPTETKPKLPADAALTPPVAGADAPVNEQPDEKSELIKSLTEDLASVTSEKDSLATQLAALTVEHAALIEHNKLYTAVTTEAQKPVLSKLEPRAELREYDKAELALAGKLGVEPGHILGINLKSGVIVTIDGRKLGGAA